MGWSYWISWVAYVPSEMLAAGLIMNLFFPAVPAFVWSLVFASIVTVINLSAVKIFGEIEFWFALIKIVAILVFITISAAILLGLQLETPAFAKLQLYSDFAAFFPNGWTAVFVTMVLVLVNFQGAEIIGLAARESAEPEKSIPKAIRATVLRINLLYIIPLLLAMHLYPWQEMDSYEPVL